MFDPLQMIRVVEKPRNGHLFGDDFIVGPNPFSPAISANLEAENSLWGRNPENMEYN